MNADPAAVPRRDHRKGPRAGKIDVAIVWGPIAGYFAKRVKIAALAVVPMKSEPGVKFDYQMAMGVRYGDHEWKTAVETLIADNRPAITAILREYNVPLIDERGELME